MIDAFIATRRDGPMFCDCEKSRMFAGTIVVQTRGPFARADHRFPCRFVPRRMRAAGEIALGASDTREPCRHARRVHLLAGMGGAGERDFLIAQAERIRRARFDERQRLHGLQRGARIDRLFHIAERKPQRTASIGDRNRAAMDAFDERPARDLHKDRVRHGAMLHLLSTCHPRLSKAKALRREGDPGVRH